MFHEIGHHIHAIVRREFREKEDVADEWGNRLMWSQFSEQQPLLKAALRPLRPLLRMIVVGLNRRLVKQGRVSKFEFNRRMKEIEPKK